MSENDNAQRAQFKAMGVHEWQGEEGSTDATNLAAIIDAQVDATLAVAYEQRTANLIALYGMSEGNTEAMNIQSGMAPESWAAVAIAIRERLGL